MTAHAVPVCEGPQSHLEYDKHTFENIEYGEAFALGTASCRPKETPSVTRHALQYGNVTRPESQPRITPNLGLPPAPACLSSIMVYVDDLKFACESCIKGHRSSSCNHADRPLFEIKKKGRPVSQCQECREARKTKSAHNKCSCRSVTSAASATATSSSSAPQPLKSKSRFKPIAPALPNGLKDVDSRQFKIVVAPTTKQSKDFIMYQPSSAAASTSEAAKPRVLCMCGSVGECRCGPGQPCEGNHEAHGVHSRGNGLSVLAQAAAICCGQDVFIVPSNEAISPSGEPRYGQSTQIIKQSRPREPSSPSPPPSLRKRAKRASQPLSPFPAPSSEPPSAHLLPPSPSRPPLFPTIPSLSLATMVPDGCCCAIDCACPGCTQHRGVAHASKEHKNCDDECETCIDHASGVGMELPALHPSASSSSSVDRYFMATFSGSTQGEGVVDKDSVRQPAKSCCQG